MNIFHILFLYLFIDTVEKPQICDCNEVNDDFHFFNMSFSCRSRAKALPFVWPNLPSFINLMKSNSSLKLLHVEMFQSFCIKHVTA